MAQTFDNSRIVLHNSVMGSQVTVNLTSKDPQVISSVPISIGSRTNVDKARTMLVELAMKNTTFRRI